jgi:ribosome-binding factor A
VSQRRQERVANLIREEVARMLARGEAKHPALESATVTGATVSPDLRSATVYFSAFGGAEEERRVEHALARSAPFFRREVGKRLGLRFAPEIVFRLDRSLAFGQEVETILERIHAEGDEPAADAVAVGDADATTDPDEP